ncbi:MAG: hypothetical protein EP346_06135 [Bacteroidetes bacterium]|uniref:Uncharacterized protein n=1 Tax=Phaeocystidibacter marisrubri TaxID=1577780 RepID=A0A6L3ZKC5_9FLAO|nr:hypothetical protein [Phaeocystidibacter marisrubri]KAB2817885.1 hypothetical protein F8C82_05635 [Phaeocystidibacter marisrubri]TNE29498.1 MAG: hypothetical protein EP346_06135 [Bacteroidota bacterium]GGH73044.1 hypothetical protein GCM10011318_17650 [Phaeocystidibacter marisrubri]
MKRETNANHDAHWTAMMGFDWMLETPSLLFNELDESESVEFRDGFERLQKIDGALCLHSFLKQNHFITSYPSICPSHPLKCDLREVTTWNDKKIEHTIHLDIPNFGELSAFCPDYWWRSNEYKKHVVELGLAGMVYQVKPEQKTCRVARLREKNDDGTSYIFTGATLDNIEPAESFYHKGWLATMELHPEDTSPLIVRVWIHKKNIPTPPETGILYSGEIWLHASLLDKS